MQGGSSVAGLWKLVVICGEGSRCSCNWAGVRMVISWANGEDRCWVWIVSRCLVAVSTLCGVGAMSKLQRWKLDVPVRTRPTCRWRLPAWMGRYRAAYVGGQVMLRSHIGPAGAYLRMRHSS